MIGLETDMVKIVPYDEEWAFEFLQEKELIERALKGYNFDIQHVGSTSLVGCPPEFDS